MRHCAPLFVSGVVFAIMAIAHVFRLFYHWTVVINGVIVPEYVGVIGLVITAVLAIWMFSALCCKKGKECTQHQH